MHPTYNSAVRDARLRRLALELRQGFLGQSVYNRAPSVTTRP